MTMLENYIPILVFMAVGVAFGVLPILFGKIKFLYFSSAILPPAKNVLNRSGKKKVP